MGGNVFLSCVAEGHLTLETPRMAPETYQSLKHKYVQLLSTYFPKAERIATAIEAPEKADFGDIDIIIIDDGEVDWADVAAELGAAAWVNRGTDAKPACSLAVHIDGSQSEHPPVKYVLTTANDPMRRKPSLEKDERKYAQIDLVKIGSDLRDWTVLYSAYGDLAGILGMAVTNFGFDITEMGLRLRLQEWDDSSLEEWKHFHPRLDEGKMMLSTNPRSVLEFFGLDYERFNEGFRTTEELFRWMSECRMISHHSLKRERNVPVTREEKKADRHMFNDFFGQWLPKHLEEREAASSPSLGSIEHDAHPSLSELRQRYLQEALDAFTRDNNDIRTQYSAKLKAMLHRRDLSTAEHLLKPIIKTHSGKKDHNLSELVRAFRRNVEYRDGTLAILDQARSDTDSRLHTVLDASGRELQDSEAVDFWVRINFDRVKEVERQREKERGAALEAFDRLTREMRDLALTYPSRGGAGFASDVPKHVRDSQVVQKLQELQVWGRDLMGQSVSQGPPGETDG